MHPQVKKPHEVIQIN